MLRVVFVVLTVLTVAVESKGAGSSRKDKYSWTKAGGLKWTEGESIDKQDKDTDEDQLQSSGDVQTPTDGETVMSKLLKQQEHLLEEMKGVRRDVSQMKSAIDASNTKCGPHKHSFDATKPKSGDGSGAGSGSADTAILEAINPHSNGVTKSHSERGQGPSRKHTRFSHSGHVQKLHRGRAQISSNGHTQTPPNGHAQMSHSGQAQTPSANHAQIPPNGHAKMSHSGHAKTPSAGQAQMTSYGYAQTSHSGQAQKLSDGHAQTSHSGQAQRLSDGYAQTSYSGQAQRLSDGYAQTAPNGHARMPSDNNAQTSYSGHARTSDRGLSEGRGSRGEPTMARKMIDAMGGMSVMGGSVFGQKGSGTGFFGTKRTSGTFSRMFSKFG